MIYRHQSPAKNKNSLNSIFIFGIIFFSILLISIIIFFTVRHNLLKNQQITEIKKNYKKLFIDKNYFELIKIMDLEIKKNPFNAEYLLYRGYSFFLLGEDEVNIDKKRSFFSSALIDLRKAMAVGISPKNSITLNFCLGKIYFYFGEAYYYQSMKFLLKSFNAGNKRIDLLYTIGLVYSYLGNYPDSIHYFLDALKIDQSDLILLAIGNAYYKSNDYDNAKQYLLQVITSTNDLKIKEKSQFLIGEILFNEKKYSEALTYFNEIISNNENYASAYYYRGEIYSIQNNIIKARAEWRKTLEIDPRHIKALKKIY